jgi:peptidylprolyl isomerase
MQPKTFIGYVLLAIIAGGAFYYFSTKKPMEPIETSTPQPTATPAESMAKTDVILKTNKGDITISLNMDKAPISAGNFLKLASDGFYTGVKFHRVIAGFMIQAGDPKGDGTGGPGYTIADEFTNGLLNNRGTIAMANTGAPHSSGSQFFINLADNAFLNGGYSVFGSVVSGMDVVDAIAAIPTNNELPSETVTIEFVEVVD